MDEPTYQFCGYDYGSFTARDTGEARNYCTIYCLSKLEKRNGCFRDGYKAERFRCVSPDAFAGVKPQSKVQLVFNRYQQVTKVVVVD